MSIVEFLLQRIAEDEALAQAASVPYDQWDAVGSSDGQVATVVGITGHVAPRPGLLTAQHIARHDPARVLAECAAKRRIMEECAPNVAKDWPFPDGLNLSEFVVAELVQPYADHPDFDPAWR